MKNLIKYELSKIKGLKSLYICSGIMVFTLLINVLTFWLLNLDFMEELGDVAGLMPQYSMMQSVLQAANNASFTMIAGIVIAMFVCHDYSQGTIKNIIAKGYSRTKVYFAKLIAVCVLTFIMYAVVIFFGFISGLLFFGYTAPTDASWIGVLSVQFLAVIAFAAFSFFISAVLRKLGLAMILIISVPTVVQLILMVIDLLAELSVKFSDFWLTGVFADLSTLGVDTSRIISGLIASLIYAVVFIISGWQLSKKASY